MKLFHFVCIILLIVWIICFEIESAILMGAQNLKKVSNNSRTTIELFYDNYANKGFSGIEKMSKGDIYRHYEAIMQGYEKLVVSNSLKTDYIKYPGYYDVLYGHHISPEKIPDLVKAGAFQALGFGRSPAWKNSIKETIVFSNTIVVGQVRKKVYHPGELFKTWVYVKVDDWLRDDYNLQNDFSEIILLQISGPTSSETWADVNIESDYAIGEIALFFLSRHNLLSMLKSSKNPYPYIKNNAFRNCGWKNIVENNIVLIDPRVSNTRLPVLKYNLNEFKVMVDSVLLILDVKNFFRTN